MDRRIAFDFLLSAVGFAGHFSIAIWLFNRLHATAWPRKRIKVLEKILMAMAALVVMLFVFRWLALGYGFLPASGDQSSFISRLWWAYGLVCWPAAVAALPCWLIPKLVERVPQALICNDTTFVDIRERLGTLPVRGAISKVVARFPGNEVFRLAIQRKTLELERLPREMNGLSIAHLSDLHLTGQLGREFFDVVVNETNALQPDLVVITGDILDKEECLSWIVPIFGRLQSRHGKYFILGNHETGLADVVALRQALCDAGLTDLGSRCERLKVGGAEILLAGNELPWFGSAPALASAERGARSAEQDAPVSRSSFGILLTHTPDQLPWARANHFDLMLAGHNHGGQIRLPYLGALISPSKYGFRYAGGLYHEPPTLLHVSRGISGIQPIRLNCPPELALLVLQSTRSTMSGKGGTG